MDLISIVGNTYFVFSFLNWVAYSEPERDRQSIEGASFSLNKLHPYTELLKDIENYAIGSMLPDNEDELLA